MVSMAWILLFAGDSLTAHRWEKRREAEIVESGRDIGARWFLSMSVHTDTVVEIGDWRDSNPRIPTEITSSAGDVQIAEA
jgi:hypothetical protein